MPVPPGGWEGVAGNPQGIFWEFWQPPVFLLKLLKAQGCTGRGCLTSLQHTDHNRQLLTGGADDCTLLVHLEGAWVLGGNTL